MNPFDFVNSVSFSKENLFENPDVKPKDYIPFIVNKSLMSHSDSIFYANEMNQHPNIPNELQYSYLINILRKRKRYSSWKKVVNNEVVKTLQEYYSCSIPKALEIQKLLTLQEVEEIKNYLDKGGKVNG